MRLVLASTSPRRAELLAAAGFTFETLAVEIDERVRPGELPHDHVRRLAAEKSALGLAKARQYRNAKARHYRDQDDHHRNQEDPVWTGDPVVSGSSRTGDDVVVLGADTAVVIDGQILGKPRDDEDAAGMLRRLSGRRHDVMTGVSLRAGPAEVGCVETTTVEFAALSEEDVDWYVASGEGRDKAGAYAIQGRGSRFIQRIQGSYSNVVGLPVASVHSLLGLIASGPGSDYSGR